ncbi:MAG: hypothetical protein HOQ12_01810 [Gemmatimonadaceae bacterium]|nr:hypothetical protein [Gemmatimonadaceae bacterium]
MIVASLRIAGDNRLPPSADLAMVRNQDRTVTLRVAGIPTGRTLAKLILTAKPSLDGSDATIAVQKVVTPLTNLATVGQITNAGSTGTGQATFTFVPADSAGWPDALVYQVWAVLDDGEPAPCLTGSLSSIAAIPLAAGPASDANLPPVSQGAIVLAFDPAFGAASQSHTARVGPAFQLGSTTSVDTNDPTLDSSVPPTRYVYGTDDYLTAGDVLDAAWTNAAGFSILAGFELVAGDVSGGFRAIVSKDSSAAARTFYVLIGVGKLQVALFDGTNAVTWDGSIVLGAGLHRLVLTYDPTQPLASRLTVRLDETADTLARGGSASLGTIANSVADLTMGGRPNNSFGFLPSVHATGNVYVWSGVPLSGADALTVSQWLRDSRGWA